MLVALLNCSLTHWTSQYMLEMARGWKNLEASEAVSNNAIEGEGDCRTMRVLKFTIHRSSLRHYCAVPTAKKRKKKRKKLKGECQDSWTEVPFSLDLFAAPEAALLTSAAWLSSSITSFVSPRGRDYSHAFSTCSIVRPLGDDVRLLAPSLKNSWLSFILQL